MAQLGIGVEFLHEFAQARAARTQADRRGPREVLRAHPRRDASGEAQQHARRPGPHHPDRPSSGAVSCSRPTRGDQFVLLRVMAARRGVDWARTRRFSVNQVSGVLEVRDVVMIEELAGSRAGACRAGPAVRQGGRRRPRRLGIDDQVSPARSDAHRRGDAGGRRAAHARAASTTSSRRWPPATTSSRSGRTSWRPASRRSRSTPTTSPPPSSARQGRIALVDGPDELLALLAKPLALWRVFLHPSQEEIAYRPSYWGSAQVTGGPGTGKTVVALHRVKHLVDEPDLPPQVGAAHHATPVGWPRRWNAT